MELTPEQKASVTDWVKSGMALSDIQKQLESEFGVRMTYMDVRFLVDDLNLELEDEGPEFDQPKVDDDLGAQPGGSGTPGEVSVTLDKVARPDALVSGSVTFSDGVKSQWSLDQTGRLALHPSQPGYQPSQEDVQKFQQELQKAVESKGMF